MTKKQKSQYAKTDELSKANFDQMKKCNITCVPGFAGEGSREVFPYSD